MMQALPDISVCFLGGWNNPAITLSAGVTMTGGSQYTFDIGLWLDKTGDRGCFIGLGRGVALQLPAVDGGFGVSVMESKTAICGEAYEVDISG